MMRTVRAALVAALLGVVAADVYMQHPRGSNDRNCERNVNRDNGNRLFDSQNNAKGGYACPRAVGDEDVQPESGVVELGEHVQHKRMYYYENSILAVEWTNQHGCGPNDITNCNIVLQYACEDMLDPRVDNFFPYTDGKNQVDAFGFKHFRFQNHVAAPRDGVPRDDNDAATDTIPDDETSAIPVTKETRRYGMHESYDYYELCQHTERNKGLYTADQAVHRNDQRGTRQNPNGNRQGLECPEERDYYPWWQPSPWIDIAVFSNAAGDDACTDPTDSDCTPRCRWYLETSFNANTKCYCDTDHENSQSVNDKLNSQAWNQNKWYNNPDACTQANFHWICVSLGDYQELPYPACVRTQYSRVNHLGNAIAPVDTDGVTQTLTTNIIDEDIRTRVMQGIPQGNNPNRFFWQLPEIPTLKNPANGDSTWSDDMESDYLSCVLRIRYNISTGDFPQWPDEALAGSDDDQIGKMVTAANNSRYEGDPRTPLAQDPYVYIGPSGDPDISDDAFLSLAVNTNQYGRTFQDRSYVFSIKPLPTAEADYDASADAPMVLLNELNTDLSAGALIYNIGVRGKRGNIVQTYPATEYNFIPDQLIVLVNDWIHFQWTGSDYNPRRGCNDGEGGPPDPNNYVSNQNNDNARADRSNVCLMLNEGYNQPRDYAGYSAPSTLSYADKRQSAIDTIVQHSFCYKAGDTEANEQCYDILMRLCFLDQQIDKGSLFLRSNKPCLTEDELDDITDKNSREQHPLNCAKLNAKPYPYLDGGLVPARQSGVYVFFSSRNNNFSNRNQPGIICVQSKGGNECLAEFYQAGTHTLQDGNGFGQIEGATAAKSASYCNDDANSGDGANNNGAPSCIGKGDPAVISGESFAIAQGDNDSQGDGDKKACEEFTSFFKDSSVEEQIGLAVGLLFVGLFTSWMGYYVYNRYQAAHPGESVFKGNKTWQKKPRENEML